MKKLKLLTRKTKQNVENCLNPKLVIENILENGFQATMKTKAFKVAFKSKAQIVQNCLKIQRLSKEIF